jgi:hypothetical protein
MQKLTYKIQTRMPTSSWQWQWVVLVHWWEKNFFYIRSVKPKRVFRFSQLLSLKPHFIDESKHEVNHY